MSGLDTSRATAPAGWVVAALLVVAGLLGLVLWPYPPDVLQATEPPPPGRTPGRLLVIAVGWSFVTAGVVAWRARPQRRIGRLLVVTGFVWIVPAIKQIEVPVLWTTGTIIDVVSLAFIAYALLAFPGDRLRGWRDRLTVALIGASLVTRPVGLVVDPPFDGLNLLSVREVPGLSTDLELATIVMVVVGLVALAATLGARWARATRPARRVLAPMSLPGIAFAVAWAIYLSYQLYGFWAGGRFDPPTAVFQVLILVFILSLLALPATFLIGLARAHSRRARAGELARRLEDPGGDLQDALRRTLGDDGLILAFPTDGGDRWLTADGHPVQVTLDPVRSPGVTPLERGGERLAVLLHDPALREDERLLEAVAAVTSLALQNQRLAAEVQARLREVRASRARIVAAGDEARRRIERDLHDGAQQRLLAASMGLRAARTRLAREIGDHALAELDAVAAEIEGGLAELRDLARGIHPTTLSELGLGPALRSLAARSPETVRVTEVPDRRLPALLEAGAYFVVSEALANAHRHAEAGTVTVTARIDGDTLVVVVEDDGRGGATLTAGGGLAGLADRVEALDGSLTVRSPAGGGTRVEACLPVGTLGAADASAATQAEVGA